jgi:hypothetical protein
MSDVKQPSKPLDCYLAGVKCDVPPSNSSWLKQRSDKRADAVHKRGDAFSESPTPLREREDRRR